MLNKAWKTCVALTLGGAMLFTTTAFGAETLPAQDIPSQSPAQNVQEEGFYLQKEQLSPVLVWGSLTKVSEDRISLKNSDENSQYPEILLNITEETLILDAATGDPVSFDSLRDGQTLYAYADSAMTRSLPPQSNALMLLCNIAQDTSVPHYVQIQSVLASDEESLTVSTDAQVNLTFTKDCPLTAYLTKNVVTDEDLIPGTRILAWYDYMALSMPAQATPTKAVVFPYEYAGYLQLSPQGELSANGQSLSLDAATEVFADEEGIIMLPLRKICDSFGYTVGWDRTARTASVTDAAGTQLLLVSPDDTTKLDQDVPSAIAYALKNGTTYISAADVEAFLNVIITQDLQ